MGNGTNCWCSNYGCARNFSPNQNSLRLTSTRPAGAAPNLAIHPTSRAMNITQASTKADIITAAMEITDSQQAKIDQLQQRQVILLGLVAVLVIANLLG